MDSATREIMVGGGFETPGGEAGGEGKWVGGVSGQLTAPDWLNVVSP